MSTSLTRLFALATVVHRNIFLKASLFSYHSIKINVCERFEVISSFQGKRQGERTFTNILSEGQGQ